MIKVNHKFDARHMNCPLPILRTKKVLKKLQSGEIIKILTDDSASVEDFIIFSNQTKNKIVELKKINKEFHILIKKG